VLQKLLKLQGKALSEESRSAGDARCNARGKLTAKKINYESQFLPLTALAGPRA
jgi:hypothetical protein